MEPIPALLIGLFGGILAGGSLAWLLLKARFSQSHLSREIVRRDYLERGTYEQLEQQLDVLKDDTREREQEIRDLNARLATEATELRHAREQLENRRHELEEMHRRSELEFSNLAGKLLDEKTAKFTQHNRAQMEALLAPLREKMKDFGDGIEQKLMDDAKEKLTLRIQIQELAKLNQQLSEDAHNLVDALKGSNKTQGDWGEFRLETILERAGLAKNVHFHSQNSFRDPQGKQKRPDFIIQLPDDKHLVIDSKVSLKAYEKCFNAKDKADRDRHLQAHIASVRRHVADLNGKNYTSLYQINTPDYLLLFIPIESAFTLAMQEDQQLFLDALDKNIVIVTTSTLLATMRTVSFIWTQDKQTKSVLEIARESGLLYDKFVGFVEDMQLIGRRLNYVQQSYDSAMNKLSNAARPGNTLIGKAERIRELGARTNKQMPREVLE